MIGNHSAIQRDVHRIYVVESANAALKGAFTDLSRGFFRVFGLTKIYMLLGFTLAAYNLDRVRSFQAKQAEEKSQPRRRAACRLGTWRHLSPDSSKLDEAVEVANTGPPG